MTTPHERMERQTTVSVHRLLIGIIACLALMLAGVVFLLIDREQVRDEGEMAQTNAVSLAMQVQEVCDDPDVSLSLTFCRQAQDVAKEPTQPVPGPQGEQGEPGPGPTMAQVQAAVRSYLTANPPAPGRPPTSAEISSAVASFCNARNDCIGSAGRDGSDSTVPGPAGQDGTDGTDGTDGEPGRPPTDEEIADAVAAFCAEGACRGAAGADGDDGSDGQDGRGIVDWYIEGDVRECELVIEFDQPPLEERRPINGLVCPR